MAGLISTILSKLKPQEPDGKEAKMLHSDFARARDSDPWTSHAAADQVAKRQHFDRILETLLKHGALGKDGIARYSGLDPNQISRRLPEMEKLNLVRPTGKIVKSKANRDEREWDIYG